ncbi:FO synthase [Nocardia sp. alder85J]|uniref:FO synthase n=1 Tax=Nocardia sp. alder85J TaxID=2862949 RepID=UPI001CD46649|nr:FO synthase [Nocardia sp. alder85J]MCX4094331.1 FO synthase [Nocardia sp. alder85J]
MRDSGAGTSDAGVGPSDSDRVRKWLGEAAHAPAALPDEGYVALLGADGPELEQLCELADALRRQAVGDTLTYVVNRNFDTAAVCGADRSARARLTALVAEARELGATEICMQGPLPADSDDDHLALIAAIAAAGPIHLHAFRPPEWLDAAARRGVPVATVLAEARDAGLGSVPGTAARILDDEVRHRLNGGPDLPVRQWIEVIEAAHRAGLFSTSTMMYGHGETPAQQVAHLRLLTEIQDRTGGFTEFIAMPWQPGERTTPQAWRQARAVHAVARLLLHERIDHIQAAWPKFGLESAVSLLRGGADDIGGLLVTGPLAPEAGAEAGRTLTVAEVERTARSLGRSTRQRTTRYGDV